MSGEIKSGRGTLIGNAGEYYVVAELLKRNVIAALAPRNAPAFDILATHAKQDKTVKIRVKTKSEHYTDWQWNAKKDGTTIFLSLYPEKDDIDDFTVLVNLTMDIKKLDFYIVPTYLLDELLKEDFQDWLKTPGKGGRPHSPDNKKRHISLNKYEKELDFYKNNWEILWS